MTSRRNKRYRVRLVVERTVHVLVDVDAASPKQASSLARDAFRAGAFDAPDIAGVEDRGHKLLRGEPSVEEIEPPTNA